MTNKELITELAKRLDWTQAKATNVLENMVTLLNTNLASNNTINVQGFGAFETKKKQERVTVNPVSKQRFLVPPKVVASFRPSQTIKDQLKNLAENE